jgi:hypothetical protein
MMHTQLGQSQPQNSCGAPTSRNGHKDTAPAVPTDGQAAPEELPILWSSDVPRRSRRWLVPGLFPAAGMVLLCGKRDAGKSLLLAALATDLGGGTRLGGGRRRKPQRVLWLTVESDLDEEVGDRLNAAGADRKHVGHPPQDADGNEQRRMRFPGHFKLLEKLVRKHHFAAVFVDPVDSFLKGGLRAKDAEDVRPVLEKFLKLARRLRILVVLTRHWRKSGDADPMNMLLGSQAWGSVPRLVLGMRKDPADKNRRVLWVMRSALGKPQPPWECVIEDIGGAGRLRLARRLDADADEREAELNAAAKQSELPEATDFLKEKLAEGEVLCAEVNAEAKDLHILDWPFRKAREQLGVRAKRFKTPKGTRYFYWLPGTKMVRELA